MGEIAIHQHVAGAPWFGMDARFGRNMPGAQWVAGLHHQGWAAWQQHSVSGGQRKVVGGLSLDVLVQVGVDRWPQLRQADAWASAEARFSHVVEGSGTFTAEVGWHTRGDFQGPWTWSASWQPPNPAGLLGCPELMWSQEGQWGIRLNPDPSWFDVLRLWRRWSRDSRCWRPEVGGGGGGPVPSSPRAPTRGDNRVLGAVGTCEPEAAWVACGPRTAWCCRVSSLGLAMGGMTLNDWTKAVVVMGLQATSFSAVVAQMALSEWSWDVPVDVWRTLSREAARGHCSWAAAEAVARHVELHGKPWAAEAAKRVEGLDTATSVSERQPWWRRWAMEQVASAAQGPS